MNSDSWAGVILLVLIFGFAILFGWMFFTVFDILQQEHTEIVREQVCNLPCKCKHLLNLGTTEWMDCMGVGYK